MHNVWSFLTHNSAPLGPSGLMGSVLEARADEDSNETIPESLGQAEVVQIVVFKGYFGI